MIKIKMKKMYAIVIIIVVIFASSLLGIYQYNKIRTYNNLIDDANKFMNQQDYVQAIAVFRQALNYKRDDKIENTIKLATKLKDNKDRYDEGIKLMTDKKYINAIEVFKKIAKDDDKLYTEAQKNIIECTKQFITQNIQLANVAIKNKKYDDANKYIDEIVQLDSNNADANNLKNTILFEKARDSISVLLPSGWHPVYEDKETKINGKDYFIFYEVSNDGTYADRRYCVDKSNSEIFIQSSDNSFLSYEDYLAQVQRAKAKEEAEAKAKADSLVKSIQKISSLTITIINISYSSINNQSAIDFSVYNDKISNNLVGGYWDLYFYDDNGALIGKTNCASNPISPGLGHNDTAFVIGTDIRNYSYFKILNFRDITIPKI